jgi:hypothetical protein
LDSEEKIIRKNILPEELEILIKNSPKWFSGGKTFLRGLCKLMNPAGIQKLQVNNDYW